MLSILCLGSSLLFAQDPYIDSLKLALKNAKHDTTKLDLLTLLSNECDLPEILNYTQPAIEIAEKLLKNETYPLLKLSIQNKLASAFNNNAFLYGQQGNIPLALNYYHQSLKILESVLKEANNLDQKNKIKQDIASVLLNIGSTYSKQNESEMALTNYNKALKIQEEIGDSIGIANALFDIGSIYSSSGNYEKAFGYNIKCLKMYEDFDEKIGASNCLNNLAFYFTSHGDFLKAREYLLRSLSLRKQMSNERTIASSYINLADNYLKFAKKASALHDKQKNYALALAYSDSSLNLAKKINIPFEISIAENVLAEIESSRGNFKEAFEHFKQYIIYRDSVSNEGTRKASIKSQLKYEFEKKEAIIKEQQEKERMVAEEKNRVQKIIITSVLIGLLLVGIFAFFVFRSLKITRQQKHIIEEKQKEILDSIRYAKRIQTSLLPTEKYIAKQLGK